MRQVTKSRRSFLLGGLAALGGTMLAGCDAGSDKEITVTKQVDPAVAAKESMDFYKKNMLKKGGAKK